MATPMIVKVPQWAAGSKLQLRAVAIADKGTLTPGIYPLAFNKPVPLLVPVRTRGHVSISLEIDVQVPRGAVFVKGMIPARVNLPFRCTSEGDLIQERSGRVSIGWGNSFSLDIGIFTWQDNRMGWPLGAVPAPSSIRVLHLLTIAKLVQLNTLGRLSVTVSNGQAHDVPRPIVPGSTGPRSAVFGPMIIELVQPVSKLNGLHYQVLFDVGSSAINKSQRDGLDAFIRQSLLSPYEVRVALQSGLLPVRGEARASATYRGTPAQRSRYNQQLSKKRKAAVVDRLTRMGVPNMAMNLIEPIGDRKAKNNEENPFERRCDISISGDELAWVVQRLWLANKFLGR